MGEQPVVAASEQRENSSIVKPSIEFYRLIDQSVSLLLKLEDQSDDESQDLWVQMGTQLEIEGFDIENISTTIHNTIEQTIWNKKHKALGIPRTEYKWTSGYFYKIMRQHNWVNPHYSHPDDPKIIPPPTKWEIENDESITVVKAMEAYLKSEKQFLKHNAHDSKIDAKVLHESNFLMHNAITHANERFNNKLKIAPSHYSILFRQFMESMSAHLSVPYYLHVRKKETFTAKQAGKIIKANVKDLPYKYEPQNEEESEACGFSGEQCPNCKLFRTEITLRIEKYTVEEKGIKTVKSRGIRQIHCFKEDADFDAPRVNLPANEVSDSKWG